MSTSALLGVIVRWMLFAAVLGTTGAAAFRFLVLKHVRDAAFVDAAAQRAAAMALVLSGFGLLASLARLPLQIVDMRDATVPLMPQVMALGFHTMWGMQWSVQVAVLIVVLLAWLWVLHGSARAWVVALVAGVIVAATPAFAGHAIGSERLSTLAVIADILHVLAAAAWLGSMLFVFATLALAHTSRASDRAVDVVTAYSPVALAAAGVLVATGAFATWLHVGSVPQLWQSRYGIVLCVKLGFVALMALTGAWNWKKAGPALRANGAVAPMWRSIRLELLWGLFVILATAVLVAVPEPGME